MHKLALLLCFPFYLSAQPFTPAEVRQWQAQANAVNIIRDNWGIPHIYGKTDADAVFGLLYAQCEDDFNRVEMNYIEKLGRKAELNGEAELYNDLYMRLVLDQDSAKADYARAPQWLRQLLLAQADGINYFLHTHPQVKPALLQRFEPWYPLLWTDGSIGAISTGNVSAAEVQQLYSRPQPLASAVSGSFNPALAGAVPTQAALFEPIITGSNGFALAPAKTANGNAILYINPHTTLFFRPEVQVSSQQGLEAYGAVTWGQFFIYQGFNRHCGWMHTSNNVDVSDMYAIALEKNNSGLVYVYDGQRLPLATKIHQLQYKTPEGIATKTITTYATHHGPIMASRNGQIIAVQSVNRSLNGLMQSWLRTKATGLASYKKVMDLCANASNNTVFADSKGNIAYWHGNFVPRRNATLNWSGVMDGSTSATGWQGLHTATETVHQINPPTGFLQNCNSTPFTVSGSSSPIKANYPPYMAPDGENFRGVNALRLLSSSSGHTINSIIALGYNRRLAAFEVLMPALLRAYEQWPNHDAALHQLLAQPMNYLRNWNMESSDTSVATTLAIEWAERLSPIIRKSYIDAGETDQVQNMRHFADTASAALLLMPMQNVVRRLTSSFGTWRVTWGSLNRFQRLSGSIKQPHADSAASMPVPFASGVWGMLPAYASNYAPGTKLRYGVSGNSFVCAVEFGKRIKAQSLLAGGNSGNPASPYFSNQQAMYTQGQFKPVLFYKADVLKQAVRQYRPGQ
ncbi:MAG: penicillin acylase family protein [Bacteroidetes bacterium]|nr:MAG: penicillin acylase family protein [Bacteroidota bacterium]